MVGPDGKRSSQGRAAFESRCAVWSAPHADIFYYGYRPVRRRRVHQHTRA